MRTGIITGASSGMGREFVLQAAARGELDEIWVIARRAERLEQLQREVSVPLFVLPLDLTRAESFETSRRILEQRRPQVTLLVNASGFGKFGRYDEIPLQDSLDMIDLNCKALVHITQLTLPYLERGAHVIQVDSLSAFQPVPYLGVYGATKAFVLSYSRSLRPSAPAGSKRSFLTMRSRPPRPPSPISTGCSPPGRWWPAPCGILPGAGMCASPAFRSRPRSC